MDPICAIRTKVVRAKEHLEEFESRIQGRYGPAKVSDSMTIGLDDNGTTQTVRVTTSAPPAEWGLSIGDCIHQLRASLDHLACALVRKKDPSFDFDDINVSFPLLSHPSHFKGKCRVKTPGDAKLETWVEASEFSEILRSQPYSRYPQAPKTDPLWIVGKLDNIDKHRAIVLLKHKLADNVGVRAVTEEVRAGTRVFGFKLPLGSPSFNLDSGPIPTGIFFGEPGVCEGRVVLVAPVFIQAVTSIVDTFEQFF